MKKIFLVAVVVVMALIGGVAIMQSLGQNSNTETTNNQSDPQQEFENPQAAMVDPCVVFDQADIEKVFGGKFEVGVVEEQSSKTADGMPITQCEYRQVNDGTVNGLQEAYAFRVAVENYNSADNAKAQMETTRASAKANDKTMFIVKDVSGIGDMAFFFTPEAPALKKSEESLHFTKDSQLFRLYSIKLSGIDHTVEQQHLQDIASTRF